MELVTAITLPFRALRKASSIASMGLRNKDKPGSYYKEYGHHRNNQLCVVTEILDRASAWGCDVAWDMHAYRSKKVHMFLMIFTVKSKKG